MYLYFQSSNNSCNSDIYFEIPNDWTDYLCIVSLSYEYESSRGDIWSPRTIMNCSKNSSELKP